MNDIYNFKVEDCCHGKEVPNINNNFSYYFSRNNDKIHQFCSVVNKIFELINNQKNFTLEIKVNNIPEFDDLYKQTK